MNITINDPAFPCMPIKDNFGRIIAPIGLTKYEHVLLSILCAKESQNNKSSIGVSTLLKECQILTNEYFLTLEKLQNAKEDKPSVIQM
tara:strand:+ start:51 stop:314 length:264 start_codon:yes stop_codon:yes gene_type:complete